MRKVLITLLLSFLPVLAFARCGSMTYFIQGSIVDDQTGKPIPDISVAIFLGTQGTAKISESDSAGKFSVSQGYSVLGKYIDGIGDVCDFEAERIDVNLYHTDYGAFRFGYHTKDLEKMGGASYSYRIPELRISK